MNVKKPTWKSKSLKNKSKIGIVIFGNTFFLQGLKCYWKSRRSDLLMLGAIRDDTWNVINMQHTNQNLKRWDYSDIPGGSTEKIKWPAHMVEGNHHLWKGPTHLPEKEVNKKNNASHYRIVYHSSKRTSLQTWRIHVTYLDYWHYIPGRFVFYNSTLIWTVFGINGVLRRIEIAWWGMG